MHALGLEFGSAARLSKRPGSVWNCLWGNALKRSPGIIHKSRVSYPGPGFLSSATWPSLPKKHYNGLNDKRLMRVKLFCFFCRQIKENVKHNDDRHSIIYLPNPFIIPGERFREFYYWSVNVFDLITAPALITAPLT